MVLSQNAMESISIVMLVFLGWGTAVRFLELLVQHIISSQEEEDIDVSEPTAALLYSVAQNDEVEQITSSSYGGMFDGAMHRRVGRSIPQYYY